jgi:hypothetical protein
MNGYSLKTIITAWLITGTMDMSTACLNYYHKTGKPIDNVLKFIASVLTGQSAFTGGADISLPGVLLRFPIAPFFVLFYFLAIYRITKFTGNLFSTGFYTAFLFGQLCSLLYCHYRLRPRHLFSCKAKLLRPPY